MAARQVKQMEEQALCLASILTRVILNVSAAEVGNLFNISRPCFWESEMLLVTHLNDNHSPGCRLRTFHLIRPLYIYIYCVTFIAECYAQGLSEVEESQDISRHCQDMPWNHRDRKATAKPHTFRQIFFHINILSLAGLEPIRRRYVAQ